MKGDGIPLTPASLRSCRGKTYLPELVSAGRTRHLFDVGGTGGGRFILSGDGRHMFIIRRQPNRGARNLTGCRGVMRLGDRNIKYLGLCSGGIGNQLDKEAGRASPLWK